MAVVAGLVVLVVVGIAYGVFLRWVATAANRKGYSYWATGLFTCFFPMIGLILVLLVPERTGAHRVALRS
jgi:hypothetical protein